MPKRKAQTTDNERTGPSVSSAEFSSLLAKYSFPAASVDALETTTPSPPIKRFKSSQPTKVKRTPPTSTGKARKNPGYAPPSAYAHLPTPDLDCLGENLILLFIGLNPGLSFNACADLQASRQPSQTIVSLTRQTSFGHCYTRQV